MADPGFPRLVSLACHDLRTPLATIGGFAKTLQRSDALDERSVRFVELIDAAAAQMTELLELLGLAARIADGRYEPTPLPADTLELASAGGARVRAVGTGAEVETDAPTVSLALAALASAAARHGGVDGATWTVSGRELELRPVTEAAAPVLTGDDPKDLGALVARRALAALGVAVAIDGNRLRVRF